MTSKRIHFAVSYCDLTEIFQKYVNEGILSSFQVIHHFAHGDICEHYHNILVPAKSIDWRKLKFDLIEYPIMNFIPLI